MATLEAVTKTANEVKDLLAKSLPPPPPAMGKASPAPMMKADDQDADDQVPPMAPEGEAPAPQGGEGMEQQPPMPGQEGQGGVDEFAQEISSMSDEELDMLLQALAQEMETRQGAQQQQGSPDMPPPAPQAAPQAAAPASSPEMDAMKAENISMRKSMQAMNASIESLKKSLAAPATRPASMNKTTQVVSKSTKEPELLNKSEVITHLETLRKSGNRSVDVDLMWTANYAKSDEEIKGVYHAAKLKGINIPTK